MLSNFTNPKKQGDAGLGRAIAWFTSQGYVVCVPLTDSQEFDLVIQENKCLKTVQVKTGTINRRPGRYEIDLRITYHNNSRITMKKPDMSLIDYYFFLLGDGRMYLVPTSDITASSMVVVGGEKYEIYEVFLDGRTPDTVQTHIATFEDSADEALQLLRELKSQT